MTKPMTARYELHNDDCLEWMAAQKPNTVHAIVTDPPYGFREYTDVEKEKLRKGRGGVWRIPPSFDGSVRTCARARRAYLHRCEPVAVPLDLRAPYGGRFREAGGDHLAQSLIKRLIPIGQVLGAKRPDPAPGQPFDSSP